MTVGFLRLELMLYSPLNLKEKRGVVRRILDRCRVRFPVSCAETGMQDIWQRAEIGFAVVAHDEGAVHSVFEKVEEELARLGTAEVSDRHLEILHY